LRALEVDDLPMLKKWRNQKHVRATTREFRLLNMINQKDWFESLFKENPPKNIMFGIASKSGGLLGVCGLTYVDWKNRHAEMSIFFAKSGWQKTKEAAETISMLLNYGFAELNLHRIWAEIFETAPDNIKLFEKMKFKKEGTLRDKLWRDGAWYNSFIYSTVRN
jgi:hypothetical protein